MERRPNRNLPTCCSKRVESQRYPRGLKQNIQIDQDFQTYLAVIVALAQTRNSRCCPTATRATCRMPGAAAAAAAETPVPKRQAKPGRGGGSNRQTASGERAVSPSTTSTSSWTRCGGRTISEWMVIDRRDPRLDWKRAETANLQDDRYLGKPCRGDHDTTNPLARHAGAYRTVVLL